MTFRRQLIIGHMMSLLLVGSIAAAAFVALSVTSTNEAAIGRDLAEALGRVQGLRLHAERVVAASRGYLLTGEPRFRKRFESTSAAFETRLRDLEAASLDTEGLRLRAEVEHAAREYTEATSDGARERAATFDADRVVPFFDETLTPLRDELEASVGRFVDHEREVFETALGAAEVRARHAQIVVVVAAVLALLLGAALARITIRKLAAQFERMRAAQEAARAAADAREEMLAIVSHDLRTPLSTIILATALLETKALEKDRRRLGTVRRAAERMSHMIDELLQAARVDAGTLVVSPEPFDAKQAIEDTLEQFDQSAVERSIHVRAECSSTVVIGDRARVVEILTNLVGNALKFTPSGGEVVLRVEPADHSTRFVVEDTGPGISTDQLPHLFDRYWQGKNADRHEGLGLGLYICKRLVEAHHGSIGIDTRIGQGSTFWFTLPQL